MNWVNKQVIQTWWWGGGWITSWTFNVDFWTNITNIAQNTTFVDCWDAPVFVNPGEFLQLCTRHMGTAGTTGTIVHEVTPIYGWE